jgi:hypothetical protein
MLSYNAVGMNAVGMEATSQGGASLACSISGSSSTSSTLTTAINLLAAFVSTSLLTATLAGGSAQLSCNIVCAQSVVSNLTTAIRLQANLQSAPNLTAAISNTTYFVAPLTSVASVVAQLTSAQVAPMFTPSLARTINVQATSPLFTGGKWWNLNDPKKPRGLKDPDAVIDISFDWTSWLDDIGSVTISDVTFTVNGVSSVGSFSDGTVVTVFVSGGTPGSAATVSCKIKTLTTPQRTDERTVYIDIADE